MWSSVTIAAIEELLAAHGRSSTGVTLFGYSGGGTLAALIASRSSKVERLVTIAAPLVVCLQWIILFSGSPIWLYTIDKMGSFGSALRESNVVDNPLDLSAWTRHHDATPLDNSLDPLSIAQDLAIPQAYFSGRQDTVVPPISQSRFLKRLPPPHDRHVMTFDGIDHSCCWRQLWPDLLKSLPAAQH